MMDIESTSHSVARSMVHEEMVIICNSRGLGLPALLVLCPHVWELMQGYGSNSVKLATSRAKYGHASRPSKHVMLTQHVSTSMQHGNIHQRSLCSSIVYECTLPVPCAASEDMGAAMTD